VKGSESIRTSVDIPKRLHQQLHEAAAKRGCSARQLVLQGIERVVAEAGARRPKRRLSLDPPIVPSRGKPFDMTNAEIYDLVELP
jgi:hypothetical protein